jgi:hypothetical protein
MNTVFQETGFLQYARHLGAVPCPRADSWIMVGQDGGQSIDLGAQTMFVYSDTLIAPIYGPNNSGDHPAAISSSPDRAGIFRANCAGITASGADLRDSLQKIQYFLGEDGYPKEILAATPEEQAIGIRFWPEHGVLLDGKVYLYYLGIQTIDPASIWGFRNLGVGLAILNLASGECQRILRGGEWRLWSLDVDDFHFGVQVIRKGDHLIVFGSLRRGFDTEGIIGRVHVSQIEDPSAYKFRRTATARWVKSMNLAGGIGPTGPEYSVSYNPFLGKYLMVFTETYKKNLMLRTADVMEGPYSPPMMIGRLPHRAGSELLYFGFEHPRFAAEDGRRVFITYCQPTFSLNEIVELCFQ